MATKSKTKRTPHEMDRLRARALGGDRLTQLADADREWIWRSLLKGVRWQEALAVAGLNEAQGQQRLETVRRWYAQRLATYKRQRAQAPQPPKVVRPIAADKTPQRRGWWPFGTRS